MNAAPEAAVAAHQKLSRWLTAEALPRWAGAGFDAAHGSFQERLTPSGAVAGDARRARVQVRQVYVFANAPRLGWSGDAGTLVRTGLTNFLRHYRRGDGLYRTLCAPDGTPLDERAFLYDQAFVLLALAESARVLGREPWLAAEAAALRVALERTLRRGDAGFASGIPERLPLLANPHMHLLEAALAWQEADGGPEWTALVTQLRDLALTHLIDAHSGALLERFGEDWKPLTAAEGQVVEPGHLFEWGWLLLRCPGAEAAVAARRLAQLGERHGVQRGVAINELRPDLTVHDATARLWPQTERLKVNARLALTDPRHWAAVIEAAHALGRYLDSAAPGLWRDRLTAEDRFVDEPAPASSFYHIVAAISELGTAVGSA
ncbi:MAG: AGE family epimerase/isomerase [Proteobacteria bacterium]|nr:AGE family epimerase/isomerase [Pseudomonadota bacterium]